VLVPPPPPKTKKKKKKKGRWEGGKGTVGGLQTSILPEKKGVASIPSLDGLRRGGPNKKMAILFFQAREGRVKNDRAPKKKKKGKETNFRPRHEKK